MSGGSSRLPVLLVHDGPHGVAAYERDLAAAVARQHPEVSVASFGADLPTGERVHVHFTDRLWAASLEQATEAFAALAARHRVSVTLHDVPQASDGERNRPRRRACYAAVASAAVAVAVNSDHERMLLAEEGVFDGDAAVVPLAVDGTPVAPQPVDDAVGVLGYFYPGKGHDEALDAAVSAGLRRLSILGRASDGHAAELDAFVRRAEASGVAVEVTGWLDDDAMAARCRAVGVPVIAHRHVSASGSLASWIGWGRRPVAVSNRYIDETAALRPGTIDVVPFSRLAEAVGAAAADPARTWHDSWPLPHDRADAAEAYVRWWRA